MTEDGSLQLTGVEESSTGPSWSQWKLKDRNLDCAHPVIYISCKLMHHYAVIEQEVLAVKWAVEEQRYYLYGRHFTLVTYHTPLQWLARHKDTDSKITSCFLSLQGVSVQVALAQSPGALVFFSPERGGRQSRWGGAWKLSTEGSCFSRSTTSSEKDNNAKKTARRDAL